MKKELPTLLEIKVKEVRAKDNSNVHEIGLAHFYWRKIKDIKEFDKLWHKAVYKKCPNKIFEYLNALSEAYEFIHLSLDCLKTLLTEKSNNDHVFLVSYFYYSLIHNTKKVLDVLALIIKTAYNLEVKDERCDFDTTKGKKFFISLEKENKHLYNTLLSSEFQDWIKTFSKERIFITHKCNWPIIPEEIHRSDKTIENRIVISNLPCLDEKNTSYFGLKDKLDSFLKVKEILILVCEEIDKKYELDKNKDINIVEESLK